MSKYEPAPQSRPNKRAINNTPAWMTTSDKPSVKFEEDESPKREKLFVLSASILSTSANIIRPMPLDLDNGLPAADVRFGSNDDNEVNFCCHIDSCAAMNAGNLRVHQWIITTYPDIVEEYIQYDDANPFQPIMLECAVEDAKRMMEDTGGKLTAIVRYKTRYVDSEGQPVTLAFGLGKDVAVNAVVGIPTLKHWGCAISFIDNTLQCLHIKKSFPLCYGTANKGLPAHIKFNVNTDFRRPRQPTAEGQAFLISLDKDCAGITDSSRHESMNNSTIGSTDS